MSDGVSFGLVGVWVERRGLGHVRGLLRRRTRSGRAVSQVARKGAQPAVVGIAVGRVAEDACRLGLLDGFAHVGADTGAGWAVAVLAGEFADVFEVVPSPQPWMQVCSDRSRGGLPEAEPLAEADPTHGFQLTTPDEQLPEIPWGTE